MRYVGRVRLEVNYPQVTNSDQVCVWKLGVKLGHSTQLRSGVSKRLAQV